MAAVSCENGWCLVHCSFLVSLHFKANSLTPAPYAMKAGCFSSWPHVPVSKTHLVLSLSLFPQDAPTLCPSPSNMMSWGWDAWRWRWDSVFFVPITCLYVIFDIKASVFKCTIGSILTVWCFDISDCFHIGQDQFLVELSWHLKPNVTIHYDTVTLSD